MRYLLAVAGLLIAVFALDSCAPQDNEPYYFLPQMETNTGALPPVSAHPFASLKDCQTVGAEFDKLDPGPVISHSWLCVRGNLHLLRPTQAPDDSGGPLPGQRPV